MIIHLIRVGLSFLTMALLYSYMDKANLETYWRIVNTIPFLTFFSSYSVNEMYLRSLGQGNDHKNTEILYGILSIIIMAILLIFMKVLDFEELFWLVLLVLSQFASGVMHTKYLFIQGGNATNRMLIFEVLVLSIVTFVTFSLGFRLLLLAQTAFHICIAMGLKIFLMKQKFSYKLHNGFEAKSGGSLWVILVMSLPIGVLPILLRKVPSNLSLVDVEFTIRIILFLWSFLNGISIFFRNKVFKQQDLIKKTCLIIGLVGLITHLFLYEGVGIMFLLLMSFVWSQRNNALFVLGGELKVVFYGQLPLGILLLYLWLKFL